MNVIFMGTPEFAVSTLEEIYNNGHHISLVVTQKDKARGRGKKVQFPPVKEKALELGIEVYQPDNINSEDSLEKLGALNPDIIVVVAYGQILKKQVLKLPKHGCLNVHASLLPKYRGAAPINWAIIDGEKQTGVTIMQMDKGLDTGDMILKSSIEISDEDDYISIHDKLAKIGGSLLIEALNDLEKGKIIRTPQDDSLSNYAPMIFKDTGKINWNKSGKDIYNLVMGLKPWPCAFTNYKDIMVKIHKVSILPKFNDEEVGKIIKVSKEGIYVNVLDSCILIEELQFPGKKILSVRDYLAGNKIEEGTVLN